VRDKAIKHQRPVGTQADVQLDRDHRVRWCAKRVSGSDTTRADGSQRSRSRLVFRGGRARSESEDHDDEEPKACSPAARTVASLRYQHLMIHALNLEDVRASERPPARAS
jgi:hypothetical protein